MLTTPEQRTTPAEIRKKKGEGIVIRWQDGHTSTFGARHLRGRCPCAQCVSESTGQRLVSEEHINPEFVSRIGVSKYIGTPPIAATSPLNPLKSTSM